jgi:hypothetical protein
VTPLTDSPKRTPTPPAGHQYNEKIDVFAFGIILYELLAGVIIAQRVALAGEHSELLDYAREVCPDDMHGVVAFDAGSSALSGGGQPVHACPAVKTIKQCPFCCYCCYYHPHTRVHPGGKRPPRAHPGALAGGRAVPRRVVLGAGAAQAARLQAGGEGCGGQASLLLAAC